MKEHYFFSIPIYRFSEDEYYKRVKKLRDSSFILEHIGPDYTYFDLTRSYSWQFNEIVGWLRLYFHSVPLQVDKVLYKHKRKNWNILVFKKQFEIRGRLTEFIPDLSLNSKEITEFIIEHISTAKNNDQEINQYHLYFDEFRQIGYALNWKTIRYSSNPDSFKKNVQRE